MKKTLVTIAIGALMALGTAAPALADHPNTPADPQGCEKQQSPVSLIDEACDHYAS